MKHLSVNYNKNVSKRDRQLALLTEFCFANLERSSIRSDRRSVLSLIIQIRL